MDPQNIEEKGIPQPLLWGLLIYETFRLAVSTRILTGGTGAGEFPGLIFGASNALFPLMAMFMAADLKRYAAYAPLYTAGKILSILVLAGSAFFWRERIIQTILSRGPETLYAAGSLLIIVLGDILSVFCGVFLVLRSGKAARDPADHGSL
jgi:hypothetical protein